MKLSDNHATYKTSCFRKNLYYDVVFKNLLNNSYEHLRDFINKCLCLSEEENLPRVSAELELCNGIWVNIYVLCM